MTGLTRHVDAPAVISRPTGGGDDRANTALGAILGALGMAMAAALVVAVIGATGGIHAATVTTVAPP